MTGVMMLPSIDPTTTQHHSIKYWTDILFIHTKDITWDNVSDHSLVLGSLNFRKKLEELFIDELLH